MGSKTCVDDELQKYADDAVTVEENEVFEEIVSCQKSLIDGMISDGTLSKIISEEVEEMIAEEGSTTSENIAEEAERALRNAVRNLVRSKR